MPNHVTNILTINGEENQVKEVMSILFDEKNNITFDGFAPMPEELRNTTSPTRIVTQEEYNKQKTELERKLASGEKVWDTSLPITKEMQDELILKFGTDNWYDWALINWGTKWGAYDGSKIDDNSVSFNSAWATPFTAMVKLSFHFPNIEFSVKYADEDFGYNVGQYTLLNGQVTEQNIPEGGSMDAIRLALDIQGNEDYYLGDMIYEMEEEQIEDSYYNKFLQYIIEKEIINEDYPSHIKQYLLEQAVEKEQFEYASKLRDIMTVEK